MTKNVWTNGPLLAALLPGLALGAAAFAPSAFAQQARHKKAEVEVTGVQQTELTKPKAPVKEEKKATGPVLTLEEFVGERRVKIVKLNTATISRFEKLIRITPADDPQLPDFHFRIAELYFEQMKINNFQARELDQKVFDAKGGQKAELQRQQKEYEKQERQYLLKAVEAYVAASQHKKYEKMDEVLFKLADLLRQIGKEDQAREFFGRLIREFPNSKYVPDAYLSFGLFYFEKQEMDAALKFFKKVEEFPKSPVYGYAIFRQGWCYINLGDFKTALNTFISVIKLAEAGKAGTNKLANDALKREARKDLVKAYARSGATPDKAWEFFQKFGGDMAPKMLETLGELYYDQGQFGDSTKVYHRIMALNPASPRLCEWQNKVVRNTLSGGNKGDQVQEIQRLGDTYDKVTTMPSVKKDLLEECRNAFHDTTKELALIWHKEAQKTKNADTYKLVKFIYKAYLDRFSKEKGAVDIAFYYGEVLWTAESWKEAAEAYTKVVEMDPKGKWVKEAAYAAVLAWKNALNIDDQGERPDKGDDKSNKPVEIPAYQQKMVAAFDTYIKYVPDSPELVKIKYRKARIFYEYNHFDKAIPLFQDVVEKHPNDELAIYAANLMLDSYNILGKPKEVVRWVERFMEMPNLMKDQDFAKTMVSLRIDSLVVEAKQYEAEGNYKECGRSMEAAADSMPEHKDHATRLYDAGVCFQNAQLIGRAVLARKKLIDAHPTNPLAQKALFKIASGWHQIAYYGEAANYYEQFATKFPGEADAAQALGNAYQFRVGLGEYEKAKQDLNNYIKFYGARKPQDAADKFFQMAEVFEREGKDDLLAKHYEAYLKQWGSKGTIEKQILAHFHLGEYYWKKSCPAEGPNGACIKIERVSATGRQKAFHEINKKIKDKKKKIKEKGRTQCGPPTKSKITVLDRGPKMAKQAQEHFGTALKLFADGAALKRIPAGADQQQRQYWATYAAAGSLFYQGEKVYEDFLRVKFPEGLLFQQPNNFDSPKKAKLKAERLKQDVKVFEAYLKSKGELASKLAGPAGKKGIFDRVLDYKVAHWVIAASARVGQIWANFVDQLYTAPIPKELKEQNEWGMNEKEMFCDALADKAEPVEAKAITGYEFCLKAATKEAWFNEWSAMCETELNQMQPSDFPLAAEARPEADAVSTLMSPAGVIDELVTVETVATPGN